MSSVDEKDRAWMHPSKQNHPKVRGLSLAKPGVSWLHGILYLPILIGETTDHDIVSGSGGYITTLPLFIWETGNRGDRR